LISQVSSPGGAVFQRVSGRTHLSEAVDVTRLGGSLAAAPFGQWLSIGGSVELTRSHIDTISESELEGLSIVRPQPAVTSRGRETIAFTADEWNPGFTVGADVRPSDWLRLSVVGRFAPEFAARLTAETRNLDSGVVQAFDHHITMNSPDVFVAGAAVTLASTRFGFEMARVDYRVFSEDDLAGVGGGFLQSPAAAWEPRAGIGHEIAINGTRRLAFSGGIRAEGVHALSGPVATPFVLEPATRTWITAGGAFAASRFTIAVAAGAAHDERRLMATVSVRSGR
jgi:hypothetical protein